MEIKDGKIVKANNIPSTTEITNPTWKILCSLLLFLCFLSLATNFVTAKDTPLLDNTKNSEYIGKIK